MADRYGVFYPRPYMKGDEQKTHFVRVGTAFPLREKPGFTCELWFNVLPGKKLVLLLDEPRQSQQADEPPPDDDIPFD